MRKLIFPRFYQWGPYQHDSQKCTTSEGGDNLSNQKLTRYDIEYDQFCLSDFTKSLCLEIKWKMIALEKLYNLVKTLNMNDDIEEKSCGGSTDFIIKLTDFFFITIDEKGSTKISLRKNILLKEKCNTDTSIWNYVLRFG